MALSRGALGIRGRWGARGRLLLLAASSACAIDERATSVVEEDEEGVEGAPVAPAPAGGSPEAGNPPGSGGSAAMPAPGQSPESIGGAPPLGSVPVGSAGAMTAPNDMPASAAGGGGAGAAGAGGAVSGSSSTPGCFEQLLADGGFDARDAAWIETYDVRSAIVHRDNPALVAAGVTPHGGDYLAWLGGVPNEEFGQRHVTTIAQTVTIPAEAISLTFSGYVWAQQSELGLDPDEDWAVLEFLDPQVAEGVYDGIWQVKLWNELDASSGWVYFEAQQTDVTRMVGRTLPFHADARPDGNGTLSVWLDSLRLEASCPM